jgi:hypothetical protein
MTSTGLLMILIGVFIWINAPNLVGVVQGNKRIGSIVTGQSGQQSGQQPPGGSPTPMAVQRSVA